MPTPSFRKVVIGELDNTPDMNTLFNVADLNRDGRLDLFTSGRNGKMAWFENQGDDRWERHLIGEVTHQECGGLAWDLDGDGWPDIINGSDSGFDELAWWRNPGPAGGRWERHLILKTGFRQFHDELIGDVTGDGRLSLVFTNQGAGALGVVPLPTDPFVSPWPGATFVARGMRIKHQPEEGLAIAELDGDGRNEIVFGTSWYKLEQGEWRRYQYADDYITTVIAVADVDGDGRLEVVVSEGDACIYGHPEGGKLGWFKPGEDLRALWIEHRVDDHLLDPHSLQVGDLCGNGHADLLVGEIGRADPLEQRPPRLFIYENDGKGSFTRHLIDQGTGVHHARLADLRGLGVLDIASRPLHGPDRDKVFVWYHITPAGR